MQDKAEENTIKHLAFQKVAQFTANRGTVVESHQRIANEYCMVGHRLHEILPKLCVLDASLRSVNARIGDILRTKDS